MASTAERGETGEGSFKSGDYESHWITYDDLPVPSHNPGSEEKSRLRVRWQEVTEKNHRQGRMVVIRGTLLITSADGKGEQNGDWVQGVRVLIARTPSTKMDWSRRYDRATTVWADTVTTEKGGFEVRIPTDQIQRVPGKKVPFQVGISLGTKSRKTITWRSTHPVLPKTVGTISVPGPKPLGQMLQLINAAPSVLDAENCNPVRLMRAVNYLHGLGKKKAIAALREYLEIAGRSWSTKRDPASIDTSNRECVFLIVRLLFEPAKAHEELPQMRIGAIVSSAPRSMQLTANPLFPLVMRGDVPFLLPVGIILGGVPQDPTDHVDWAEKHAILRARPLRPTDNPMAAVDALPKCDDTEVLRQQAWRMIEHLVGPWQESDGRADAVWKNHEQKAAKLKIRWNEKKQQYVAGRK
jgi:hypothetical protein